MSPCIKEGCESNVCVAPYHREGGWIEWRGVGGRIQIIKHMLALMLIVSIKECESIIEPIRFRVNSQVPSILVIIYLFIERNPNLRNGLTIPLSPLPPRLVEVNFRVDPQGCGLGISIVGGTGSPTGDLPIVIKRILPLGLAARDGRLKAGDQLIAVNEWLLIGVSKNYALNALSNLEGHVRLLVLQDY